MPTGGRRFSDVEMLVEMEDEHGSAARSRAGSCVEIYGVRVSFYFSLIYSRDNQSFPLKLNFWNAEP